METCRGRFAWMRENRLLTAGITIRVESLRRDERLGGGLPLFGEFEFLLAGGEKLALVAVPVISEPASRKGHDFVPRSGLVAEVAFGGFVIGDKIRHIRVWAG